MPSTMPSTSPSSFVENFKHYTKGLWSSSNGNENELLVSGNLNASSSNTTNDSTVMSKNMSLKNGALQKGLQS